MIVFYQTNKIYEEWEKRFVGDGKSDDLSKFDIETIKKQIFDNNLKIDLLTKKSKDVSSEMEKEMIFGSDMKKVIELQKQHNDFKQKIELLNFKRK